VTRGRGLAIGLTLASAFAVGLAIWIGSATRTAYRMPAGSMEPAIHAGERLVVDTSAYASRAPRAGDVVVFHVPFDETALFVQRVAAVGPAEVNLREDGTLVIDGEPVDREAAGEIEVEDEPGHRERYAAHWEKHGRHRYKVLWRPGEGNLGYPEGPWPVHEDRVFLLGDNRLNSHDSRYWGPVERSAIVGRVEAAYLGEEGDAVRRID
jgi:signal peptidase I